MGRIALIGLIAAVLALSQGAFAANAAATDEYQQSSKLLGQQKYTQALQHIDRFIAAHPEDARGRFLKGVILSEDNRRADAIKVFTDLTHDYPGLAEPYNNLAVLYAGQGEYDKARQLLDRAIRINPRYATALENLGDVYARMADDAYTNALQIDGKNSTTRAKLALIKQLLSTGTGKAATETAPAHGAGR
jgi:tetratricopeptide (TPR) repeat protein